MLYIVTSGITWYKPLTCMGWLKINSCICENVINIFPVAVNPFCVALHWSLIWGYFLPAFLFNIQSLYEKYITNYTCICPFLSLLMFRTALSALRGHSTKYVILLYYGKCRIHSCFWLTLLGIKSQDISSPSAVLILSILVLTYKNTKSQEYSVNAYSW